MSDDPADPPGLDLARLRAHLDAELPGLVRGPLRAELFEGGRSNLTYRVTDGTGSWVLRRPPLGHVLATAHDMAREYRVIAALGPTAVPVPEVLLLVEDPEVLGAPWYLMEHVAGVPHRDPAALAALGEQRVYGLGLRLVETLVALHAVDPAAVGLADFGRPDGFLERQLRRWERQLEASRSREVPGIAELRQALAESLPVSPAPALVHGDYRLDNVLVGPDDEIAAVLDWEMSTLGDPLTDLGLLVMYTELARQYDGILPGAALAPGFPCTAELVGRYAASSGRDVSTLGWYVGFASFKLAVVLEGIHYRYSQGRTVGAGFDRVGELVPLFVQFGLTSLKER
ncbi:aminoglycoside phosphotransferase (APT) family kinase protein [Kitasatospora gansuensis]|uniref:Aminoglycoside phosphotransferase (APT) family kinase protein n=1 Tax=Kitasatospora gansuensis TaxID=258050 RepID=A0A7W7SHY4_9ACTN|nr:phosphotransferase family protein [Kitasatospora gansuensis]MBB4950407.1 aminoglycoside phosphotransferase (APT) family kinase protein [Kitasatospora gansuensis]